MIIPVAARHKIVNACHAALCFIVTLMLVVVRRKASIKRAILFAHIHFYFFAFSFHCYAHLVFSVNGQFFSVHGFKSFPVHNGRILVQDGLYLSGQFFRFVESITLKFFIFYPPLSTRLETSLGNTIQDACCSNSCSRYIFCSFRSNGVSSLVAL